MFENFDREIQSFFTNNYFYDEPDELDIRIDLNVIIENINYIGSEKIITSQILFTNKKDQHFSRKVLILLIKKIRHCIKVIFFIL